MATKEDLKRTTGTEKWLELKKDLEQIPGVSKVTEEDEGKWGHREGFKYFVIEDDHGNKWNLGRLFKVSKCPFKACIDGRLESYAKDGLIDTPEKRKAPNPTIFMTLMSLYYQYLYCGANNNAHRSLTCIFGHQMYRMIQRVQFSKNDNLPDKFLIAEYKKRFDIFEKIKHDARIGLFADKSTESVMNYIDKRYGLPFMLNKDISQTLAYSIHPDAFWPSSDDIKNYVEEKKEEALKKQQMWNDHKPNLDWIEIYGTK
jgi:hypothetical protein